MTWLESIERWRQLPERRKLQIRWESIPEDVARSMAFAGEPVPVETLRAIFARIEPPAALRQPKASSGPPS